MISISSPEQIYLLGLYHGGVWQVNALSKQVLKAVCMGGTILKTIWGTV